jgi:hypothetical protein
VPSRLDGTIDGATAADDVAADGSAEHAAAAGSSTPTALPHTVTGAAAATEAALPETIPDPPPLDVPAAPPLPDELGVQLLAPVPTVLPHTVTGALAVTATALRLTRPLEPEAAGALAATVGAPEAAGEHDPAAKPRSPTPLPHTVTGKDTDTAAPLPSATWAPATPPPIITAAATTAAAVACLALPWNRMVSPLDGDPLPTPPALTTGSRRRTVRVRR